MGKVSRYLAVAFGVLLTIQLQGCKDTLGPTADYYEGVSVEPAARQYPWWRERHQQKLAEKKALGDVQLVFIGDSITHAWETQGEQYWQSYYGMYRALNLGYSGDRTENVLWRLQHGEVEGINPRLLVMMIGTNNAGHRREPSQATADGIAAILDELRVRLPQTRVLLLAIFPRGRDDSDAYRQLNMGTNAIIKGFADGERVFWLNINDQFLDENRVLRASVMSDFLHPNAGQYEVWGRAIEPYVQTLMAD